MSRYRCNCSPGCTKLDGKRHYYSPTAARIDRLDRLVRAWSGIIPDKDPEDEVVE